MRKVSATLLIAFDGVVEAPDQWHIPYLDDEMDAAGPAERTGEVGHDGVTAQLARS